MSKIPTPPVNYQDINPEAAEAVNHLLVEDRQRGAQVESGYLVN